LSESPVSLMEKGEKVVPSASEKKGGGGRGPCELFPERGVENSDNRSKREISGEAVSLAKEKKEKDNRVTAKRLGPEKR